jgi:hypothetical protein
VHEQLDSIDGLPECIIKLADLTVYMCNTYFKNVLSSIENILDVGEWAIDDKAKKVNSMLKDQKTTPAIVLQDVQKDFWQQARVKSLLLGEKFILYFFANLLFDEKNRNRNMAYVEELAVKELGMDAAGTGLDNSPWSECFIGSIS